MKKFLCFFVFAVLLSCSDDSDSSTNENPSESILNPPTWIHGTWMQFSGNQNIGVGFKFTDDDYCNILVDMTSCWKNVLETPGQTATATEEISNTDYTVTIHINASATQEYHFHKKSSTEVQINGVIYTKVN